MDTRDTFLTAQPATEDGAALLCWRCRHRLDTDLYCECCGALSTPPGRQPHPPTLEPWQLPLAQLYNLPRAVAPRLSPTGVLTTENVPVVPSEFGAHPRKRAA